MSVYYHQIIATALAADALALADSAMAALDSAGLLGAVSESTYDGPAREVLWAGKLVGHAFVRTGNRFFHSGEATTPPRCPRCGAMASGEPIVDQDAFTRWWQRGPEPVLTCPRCGFAARWTEWDVYEALVCGDVAIVIHDHARSMSEIAAEPRKIAVAAREIIVQATSTHWVVTFQHA